LLVCLVVGLVLWARHNRRTDDDWEVDMGEIEFGEQLGAGGFGVVNKAVWKGTEVAVKMMTADANTRELERNFKEEVRVRPCVTHPWLICSHLHSFCRCAS
jgi:serine/threonine protein kinase